MSNHHLSHNKPPYLIGNKFSLQFCVQIIHSVIHNVHLIHVRVWVSCKWHLFEGTMRLKITKVFLEKLNVNLSFPVQYPEAKLSFCVLPFAKCTFYSHIGWHAWYLQRRHFVLWAHTTLIILLEIWKWGYAAQLWRKPGNAGDGELWAVAKNIRSAGIAMATV